MSDRLGLDRFSLEFSLEPDPTPVEFEVVATALAEALLHDAATREPMFRWQLAGLEESVDRTPQALEMSNSEQTYSWLGPEHVASRPPRSAPGPPA
jgi:hypothetical protein